jgi:hypothetical protein
MFRSKLRIVKRHVIKKGEEYRELGDQYLAAKSQKNKLTRIRRDAEELGFNLVPIVAG